MNRKGNRRIVTKWFLLIADVPISVSTALAGEEVLTVISLTSSGNSIVLDDLTLEKTKEGPVVLKLSGSKVKFGEISLMRPGPIGETLHSEFTEPIEMPSSLMR
jgi:hypothetical protein